MSTPTVYTDQQDYALRTTAAFTASGFTAGSRIQFQVVNDGADGIFGTADDMAYQAWIVTDGGADDTTSNSNVSDIQTAAEAPTIITC